MKSLLDLPQVNIYVVHVIEIVDHEFDLYCSWANLQQHIKSSVYTAISDMLFVYQKMSM